MNEWRLFEQTGQGKRGGWTSQGQRITTRHQKIQSQQPAQPDADEDEIYDEVYPTRLPTSTRRYNVSYDLSDEEVIQQGNKRLHIRYVDVPKRTHAQLPPASPRQRPYQQDIYEDAEAEPVKQKKKVHWLVFLGIGMIVMLIGWYAFSSLATWWQIHTDDVTYGNPRTYQTDAVVGHSDSPTNPTHFIAFNLNGNILVIELPGGDAAKARSYTITSIPGNAGNPPVKLVFQDINRDGKLDLVVQIGDPGQAVTVILFNNGTQFVSKL
jgi:hypothetical protein